MQPPPTALLEKNLAALDQTSPTLAARIRLPVESSHLVLEPSGEVHRLIQSNRYRLTLRPAEVDSLLEAVPRAGPARFLFGLGTGELLARALQTQPDGALVAWERDPYLLRLALGRHDFSRALLERRLELWLGVDLARLAEPPRAPLLHPQLSWMYRRERRLLEQGVGPKRALLAEGDLFVDDVAEALAAEGYSLYTVDLLRLSQEEIAYTFEQFAPAFLFAVNYLQGVAEFCTELGRPLLCWEVDPTVGALEKAERPTHLAHVFTYRRSGVEELRRAGIDSAAYLPLAANPQRRRPPDPADGEAGPFRAPVAFVGNSMVEQAKTCEAWFVAELSRHLPALPEGRVLAVRERVLAAQAEDESKDLTRALLLEGLPEVRGLPEPVSALLARLLGEIAASRKRLHYVAALADAGVDVWGDEGWRSAAAPGVRYRGPADHFRQLNQIYAAAGINLDVGRLFQSDIVTMRVFDVLACGGFVLAEHSPALEELFAVGEEVDSYRSLAELTEKARFYLAHPERARAIAARGLEAVRARHTVHHRVKAMLGRLA